MNILLLGGGGREHALAWKMAQSPHCTQLFIAPGNGGTLQHGTNVNIKATDFSALKEFAINSNIDMIVVGPEEPLVKGVYDYFTLNEETKHIIVIGPSAEGAQLEGSKAFSKKFMQQYNIPTAAYAEFTKDNYEAGKAYITKHTLPVVLKADGLAAGKGVVIAATTEDALHAFEEMIINQQFGDASSKVVIEQFLDGIEVSVFVLTNTKEYKIIGHAKDYKRIGEGDTGLNTGGMGCITPVPFADDAFMQKVIKKIIEPTIKGLSGQQIIYNGFIFFGLIKVGDEPFVIEYNCRMGDPETEVVMPCLENDIVELFLAAHNNTLSREDISIKKKSFATVVAVSKGYPGSYEKGKKITDENDINDKKDVNDKSSFVFQAGTKLNASGELVTDGGRVLAVTSFGNTIQQAVQSSNKTLESIHFEGLVYRKDIGYEFI